jgi:hypothetical protein
VRVEPCVIHNFVLNPRTLFKIPCANRTSDVRKTRCGHPWIHITVKPRSQEYTSLLFEPSVDVVSSYLIGENSNLGLNGGHFDCDDVKLCICSYIFYLLC